jgi:hypothetical protein
LAAQIYLGNTPKSNSFAAEFIKRKRKVGDQALITPSNEFVGVPAAAAPTPGSTQGWQVPGGKSAKKQDNDEAGWESGSKTVSPPSTCVSSTQ